MNFKLNSLFISALLLLSVPAFADIPNVEASGVNPLDKKTKFINNHHIAFSVIKIDNETKKFIAVIPAVGSKRIVVYEVNPATNALTMSATFKEHLYSPFYITFDSSGKYLYGVSGTRNFVTQYKFDPVSKKFVPNQVNQQSADLQTACADNAIFNFDYFRTVQFFPSGNKAYITCEDLRGEFYVVGYQFDSKTGLLMNPDSPLWKESKQSSREQNSIVEKSMVEITNPLAVLIDPSGKYLYFADAENTIHQYKLNQNGKFGLTPYSFYTDEAKPGSMTFDPSGKNVYVVAHDRGGNSVIVQYKFDPSSGKLDKSDVVTVPNKVAKIKSYAKANATHIQFAPSGHYAYVLDDSSNLIYQYRVDSETGNLTLLNPAAFITCSIIRSLVFDPDPSSHFAYAAASNRAELKPQNEKLCQRRMTSPFELHVDRLVIDPATGQLANFVSH